MSAAAKKTCAPTDKIGSRGLIYPCIIHMTPCVFGKDKSQAMIGVQMAFAYTGFLIMPTLFGMIADGISISLLPPFIFVLLAIMAVMHELVVKKDG